jgi:alginate O-acetyltransferase complex protein AlgI
MATMLLGGLWHGAGWTFVVWGGLHGTFIIVNHLWHGLRHIVGLPAGRPTVWGRVAGTLITFLAVVIAWVFFRAKSFAAASDVLAGMAGQHGALLPSQLVDLIPLLGHIATGVGVIPDLAGGTILGFVEMTGLLVMGLAIVFFAPHLHQVTARTRLLLLVPSFAFVVQKLLFAGDAAPFLYFQF